MKTNSSEMHPFASQREAGQAGWKQEIHADCGKKDNVDNDHLKIYLNSKKSLQPGNVERLFNIIFFVKDNGQISFSFPVRSFLFRFTN